MKLRNLITVLVAASLGFALGQLRIEPESTSFAQATERPQVSIDDTKAVAVYANFCRVTGTPEEVILDYGLNPQPFGVPAQPIPVSQRIVLNFYTAKRMLQAVDATIQRHEAIFGKLETDVQKRVKATGESPSVPTRGK